MRAGAPASTAGPARRRRSQAKSDRHACLGGMALRCNVFCSTENRYSVTCISQVYQTVVSLNDLLREKIMQRLLLVFLVVSTSLLSGCATSFNRMMNESGKGNYDAALALSKESLPKVAEAKSATALFMRCHLEFETRNYTDAEACLNIYETKFPVHDIQSDDDAKRAEYLLPLPPRIYWLRGKLLMSRGDFVGAEPHVKRAYDLEKRFLGLHSTLALVQAHNGKKPEALALLKSIQEFENLPWQTRRFRDLEVAKIYFATQDFNNALQILTDTNGTLGISALHFAAGATKAALCVFSPMGCLDAAFHVGKALTVEDIIFADKGYLIARSKIELGRVAEAKPLLEELSSPVNRERRPDLFARLLFQRARIAEMEQNKEGARKLYEEAIAILVAKPFKEDSEAFNFGDKIDVEVMRAAIARLFTPATLATTIPNSQPLR